MKKEIIQKFKERMKAAGKVVEIPKDSILHKLVDIPQSNPDKEQ